MASNRQDRIRFARPTHAQGPSTSSVPPRPPPPYAMTRANPRMPHDGAAPATHTAHTFHTFYHPPSAHPGQGYPGYSHPHEQHAPPQCPYPVHPQHQHPFHADTGMQTNRHHAIHSHAAVHHTAPSGAIGYSGLRPAKPFDTYPHAYDAAASHAQGTHPGAVASYARYQGLRAEELVAVSVEPVTPPVDIDDDDGEAGGSKHVDDKPLFPGGSQISTRSRSPERPSFRDVDDIPDDQLADTIALVLTDFCKASGSVKPDFPERNDPAMLFFSPYRQKAFTLNFYCKRLLQYTYCSKSCFVVAILYVVRLSERYPVFELNDYNVHRLICTAVVLAAKFVDDTSFNNAHYAKVAGIQTAAEMNKLEATMLKALDYRLFVNKKSYRDVEKQIAIIARECT